MNLINEITKEYQKNDIPKFHVGDTVKVHIKIKEGARERIQIFEGTDKIISVTVEQLVLNQYIRA